MSAALFSLQQLSLAYPATAKTPQTFALLDVTLDIQANDFVGIIGPNGAGKSSLLQLLNGAVVPSQGKVLFTGRPLYRFSPRELAKNVASVAQINHPAAGLRCRDVAAMGLLPYKRWFDGDNEHDEQRVLLALGYVGLQHKALAFTNTLSGGELQRLYIARALVQQARVLLLDEPTNHLDVQYQHQILQLLQRIGKTVVCCIHDLNLAARYCNKLLLLAEGRVVAFGAPAEVLQAAQLEQVFSLPCEVSSHPDYDWQQVTFFATSDRMQSRMIT